MLLICYGTRPEYIKVKSLIDNLPNVETLFTGQHNTLIGEHHPTYSINIIELSANRLNNIISSILSYNLFDKIEYVLVQGDTTSALAIAISAFNCKKKIIHLEAGLRTNDMNDPFPEEMNRQLISRMAYMHLCPTHGNLINLKLENINTQKAYVTGNTGLDGIDKSDRSCENIILITLHRRDNVLNMNAWFCSINLIASHNSDLRFVFPMHPSPDVQRHRHLLTSNNILVTEPLDHNNMLVIMKKCKFIITDSGGLQEEAAYLNKKIIVCRKTTERPETIGLHATMCPIPDMLPDIFDKINQNPNIDVPCPYGDGAAWKIIKDIFEKEGIV